MEQFLSSMTLEKLPVPGWLELPPVMLALLPLLCVLLLAFVIRRLLRISPRPRGVFAFLAIALVGSILQVTDYWWQYSVPTLSVMTAAAFFCAVEVAARSDVRRHGNTVAAVAAINSAAYFYLAAVLSAYS